MRGKVVRLGAVIRGDTEQVSIGDRSNVQDLCVLHADPGLIVEAERERRRILGFPPYAALAELSTEEAVAWLETKGLTHRGYLVRAEVAGTVTLRSTGPLLIVDFDLSALQPVEIVAGYSDKSIWFNGFAQLESTGTSIAAETGAVTFIRPTRM